MYKLLDAARENQFLCFSTSCIELNHALPFHPFRQLLDELLTIDKNIDIRVSTTRAKDRLPNAIRQTKTVFHNITK